MTIISLTQVAALLVNTGAILTAVFVVTHSLISEIYRKGMTIISLTQVAALLVNTGAILTAVFVVTLIDI